MKTSLTAFLSFIFICVTAQQKYNWSKYDSLPFKEDSVQIEWLNYYDNIIPPITKSKANIEVRCYLFRHNKRGRLLRLRCFKNSILLESIDGIYNEHPSHEDSIRAFKIEKYYSWQLQKIEVNMNMDSLLNTLINKGLFSLGDVNVGREILKQKHKTDITTDSTHIGLKYSFIEKATSYFEVKVNNRYRSFNTYNIRYDDEKANTDNYYLGWDLFLTFTSIFNNVKTKKNEIAY